MRVFLILVVVLASQACGPTGTGRPSADVSVSDPMPAAVDGVVYLRNGTNPDCTQVPPLADALLASPAPPAALYWPDRCMPGACRDGGDVSQPWCDSLDPSTCRGGECATDADCPSGQACWR